MSRKGGKLLAGGGVKRAGSVAIVTGEALAKAGEVEFVHCCHCGKVHAVRQSIEALILGRVCLEYCARCDGVYCAPGCAKCVPLEHQLENVEAGRAPLDSGGRVVVAGVDMAGVKHE